EVDTVAWSLSALFSSWQTFGVWHARSFWSAVAGVSDFAVLGIGSAASPSIVTWIVICADAPTAKPSSGDAGFVHVTIFLPESNVHVLPLPPMASTNVV